MNLSGKNIQSLVLVLAALAIWAIVFAKYFGFSPNAEKEDPVSPLFYAEEVQSQKEYVLLLNYDDPFLKTSKNRRKKQASTTNATFKKTRAQEQAIKPEIIKEEEIPIVWPEIHYKGMGKNKSRDERLAWIEYNGEMKIFELNTVVNGYKVEAIYHDSLIISYEGEMKKYLKSK